MCDVYSGAATQIGIYLASVPKSTRHRRNMATARQLPHDPGDDVSSMCVNLRILSRLTQGEKLCSVKDKYYAVQDGTTYQSSLLRYVRNDSRRETCQAIEVSARRLLTAFSFVCISCALVDTRFPGGLRRCCFGQTLFARVAAANSTATGAGADPVPRDLIAAACEGVGVLMKTYAQDKQVVSRLEQVQRRYCGLAPAAAKSSVAAALASASASASVERTF